MKKIGIVLSVAAVAAITGCKDPNYKGRHGSLVQNDAKTVAVDEDVSTPVIQNQDVEIVTTDKPEPPAVVDVNLCTCPPGTVHTGPCPCGASDCSCKVVEPEPEYTEYIVQRGDYIAKISRKYNITIAAIRKLNPQIKGDVIKLGQKIKLPGKVDVGEQKMPTLPPASATARSSGKTYVPYTGATVEYVVKSGDTLGALAYGHGINIRQLKELNSLSSDNLRIGQKLKIPAGKVEAKAAEVKQAAAETSKAVKETVAEKKPVVKQEVEAAAKAVEAGAAEAVEEVETQMKDAEDAAAEAVVQMATHVVQEGEDILGVSIQWGVPASVIRELNNIGDDDQLVPGQVLKMPADAQLQ